LRCQVLSTDGSVANLRMLRNDELDAAVVQSDWQYHAYQGTPPFDDQPPLENLRTLFALHDEPFTVLARTDSGIQTLEDLRGKRVNIGNPGSGQRATMEVLMEALGWGLTDFGGVSELPAGEQAQALCDDEVDAIVFTVGHPNASILEATALCEVRLVPVAGPAVEALVASHPYYFEAQIPGGLYRGSPDPVPSFGVRGMFTTTAALPEEEVYELVRAVFEEFDGLRYAHPALGQLTPEAMVQEAFAVPLHPGAEKYYRERRLLR
jgi:TRAP transporter TAXI family solute receptor